ncbi:MAG: hypothetical protein NT155_04025 [Candidatus Staskawiczbacteria bacterium]|nr:hypothetical protein [Candidatus Staskawiczbacteria bacterium]
MLEKINRILVLVFGATTGATLHEFKVNSGYRPIWKKDIPWQMAGKVYFWPMDWLKQVLAEVREMATPGTIIAPAMWGADVVHMWGDRIEGDVLHYRSVPEAFANQLMAETGIPKHEWSRLMGNVNAEFYQMVFSGAFWRNYTQDQRRLEVVPLADWMTWWLSGYQGHDPVMLCNQGAGAPTSKLVNRYFNENNLDEFAPVWRVFGANELLPLQNGAFVMPCTHDSPIARLILASTGLAWGLWTGSWYGVFRAISKGDKIVASEQTYKAGLVFEAMPGGGVSAISNIAMDGPRYKALKNVNGEISYRDAADLALARIYRVAKNQTIFPDEMMKLEPGAFATAAMAETKGSPNMALAIMANTIAMSSKKGLEAAASALGLSNPESIAIVGGFAENAAILKALELNGINPIVPPFAGMATQAGLAARALCLSGTVKTVEEALAMFPETVLAD